VKYTFGVIFHFFRSAHEKGERVKKILNMYIFKKRVETIGNQETLKIVKNGKTTNLRFWSTLAPPPPPGKEEN
jgi:hypothetical protein